MQGPQVQSLPVAACQLFEIVYRRPTGFRVVLPERAIKRTGPDVAAGARCRLMHAIGSDADVAAMESWRLHVTDALGRQRGFVGRMDSRQPLVSSAERQRPQTNPGEPRELTA
jgi:hypothetical protein